MILGGSCNGLSFARSLGRRQIPTLLLDTDPLLGTFTRFGKVVLLPSADEHPDQWLALLEFVGARLDQPAVLFATSDLHALFVSEHREILRRHYRFVMPDHQSLHRIVNKRCQYESAFAAGIPIPKTYFPESADQARDAAAEMSYPCILKPYCSHTGRQKMAKKKVVVAQSAKDLLAAYDQLTALGVPLMIQEIIPGGDSGLFGYLGFWDNDGRERAWLTKQKLRQNPPGFGDGSLQITVHAPQLAELSRRLLQTFDYRGFVGVEFKLHPRDHTYRLIEINPRTVSGNQLAITAGVDFPWIGYQYLTGSAVPTATFRAGLKYVNEEWDIQSFLAMRRTGEINLWRWLVSLSDVKAWGIGAWDDPRPLLAGLARFARLALPRTPTKS